MAWYHTSSLVSETITLAYQGESKTRPGHWVFVRSTTPDWTGASVTGGASVTLTTGRANLVSSDNELRSWQQETNDRCIVRISGIGHLSRLTEPIEDDRLTTIKRVHPVVEYPSQQTRGTPE